MALIKQFRIKEFKKKQPVAKLEKISLSFAKRQILDNISFNLNAGEIVGLLGPNGAGKSTIFNILMGLIKPDFGKVLIENTDATNLPIYLRARKFKIGYVPQYGGYFNDLSLIENLKAIGEIILKDDRERLEKIHYLIYPAAILSSFHFFMLVRANKTEPILYIVIIFLLLSYRFYKKIFIRR